MKNKFNEEDVLSAFSEYIDVNSGMTKKTKFLKNYRSDRYYYYINNEEVYHFHLNYWKNHLDEVIIVDVFVQPKFRGQGYFHEIMKNALSIISNEHNINTIFLSTFKNATIAEQYIKYDFECYAETKHYDWWYKNNQKSN